MWKLLFSQYFISYRIDWIDERSALHQKDDGERDDSSDEEYLPPISIRCVSVVTLLETEYLSNLFLFSKGSEGEGTVHPPTLVEGHRQSFLVVLQDG